jgi:hypothetical protein
LTALDPAATAASPPAQFEDRRSGATFYLVRPFERPDLWKRYIDGALETYRSFAVESALELERINNGLETTLFMVGIDCDDRVVAGIRFQGPFRSPSEAHVCEEFAGSPGYQLLRQTIGRRLGEGVIEFKGGWAANGNPLHGELSDAIARTFVHAMDWLGCRWGLCSAALYATRRWQSSGGRIMSGLEPIPYPDERYETTVLWWDRRSLERHASTEQLRRIRDESLQIAASTWVPATHGAA